MSADVLVVGSGPGGVNAAARLVEVRVELASCSTSGTARAHYPPI